MAHKLITVERGDAYDDAGRRIGAGYAARCTECDAITFGGFSSRTAAREALRDHEGRGRA